MSSQPNKKAPEVPDALVKELLRSQGLPLDSHVKVTVNTTRVRVNPDGTRTVLSRINSSAAGRALRSARRPSKLVAVVMWAIGFLQLSYGMWAGHSDALAASLIHANESCRLEQLKINVGGATPPPSTASPCRIEPAIVVDAYRSASRHGTTYRVITTRPDGTRDDTPVAARGGFQFWKHLRPTELIRVQRFVVPGYHLTGSILALGDDAGTSMSRDNPDSGAYPNALAMLLGGAFVVMGMFLFVQAQSFKGA